ncbi:unnamed protein product [Rotaria magnacalcarata]|uniref:Uncharacterized protein n=1 Tax=Rotaria magnacalcarata TaxID=392030 RepID=A0A815EHC1_9BILA|nr:unnamed protein product [Rotaria magnacalcarata]CAF4383163.1 unnamed protein product [Rotaria magnacalcarata]
MVGRSGSYVKRDRWVRVYNSQMIGGLSLIGLGLTRGPHNPTGIFGDGVNDAPALAKAIVGMAIADTCDAARSAFGIVLTEPCLSVIIDAILGSWQIFARMTSYAIYACSITIRIILSF